MDFEWDERKRLANLAKHEIDFIDVMRMFAGPTISVQDMRKAYGEVRFIAFGLLDGRALVATYTLRGTSVRLISARVASRRERAKYYDPALHARTGHANERPH